MSRNTSGARWTGPLTSRPAPSDRQLSWHAREFYGFVHFTVNTFTDLEWGYGDESPTLFDPERFDPDQIAETARNAGMSGLILTCKHHDGFCLWPSRHTGHSIASSPWRNGKGDLVAELSAACGRAGIGFGVYLSPWDRNHHAYGTEAYVDVYREQLRELLTGYGELFEIWFDGANGGDGYYGGARETRAIDPKRYYQWERVRELVRELQPGACIFSDAGPDIRWVGNEDGVAGDPCWHTFDVGDSAPGAADRFLLNHGVREGASWLPAECDVSIRPGWFYHRSEDDAVRTPGNLMELYYASVGRGAALNLNLPPDRRGLIHENDCASLERFAAHRRRVFGTDLAAAAVCTATSTLGDLEEHDAARVLEHDEASFWIAGEGAGEAAIIIELGRPVRCNVVELREHLPLGQSIDAYRIESWDHGTWRPFCAGSGIGHRRLLRGCERTTTRFRITCTVAGEAAGPIALSRVALFHDSGLAYDAEEAAR